MFPYILHPALPKVAILCTTKVFLSKLRNWHWYTVVDCKEIQPVHSEGDQPWDFFGRNDAKAETPVLGPPHAKS